MLFHTCMSYCPVTYRYVVAKLAYRIEYNRIEYNFISMRPVARGFQGVLENPPFYEPPFLGNTNPPIAIIRVVIRLN